MSRRLSAACAEMLMLREITETTTLRMIRQITTDMESFTAPVLVDMVLIRFFIGYPLPGSLFTTLPDPFDQLSKPPQNVFFIFQTAHLLIGGV